MIIASTGDSVAARLFDILGLPSTTTHARLILDAGEPIRLEATRLLTQSEVLGLGAALYETGCQLVAGDTTYYFVNDNNDKSMTSQ